MKKGRSNKGSSRLSSKTTAKGGRFTLPKRKILRGRTNFDRLFDDKAVIFKNDSVRVRFRIYNHGETDCKMAFIVPRRLGKAAQRNRMKRHLKEAYRLNQYIIADAVTLAGCVFHGALMANRINAEYDEIKSNIVNLLKQAKNYISKTVEK